MKFFPVISCMYQHVHCTHVYSLSLLVRERNYFSFIWKEAAPSLHRYCIQPNSSSSWLVYQPSQNLCLSGFPPKLSSTYWLLWELQQISYPLSRRFIQSLSVFFFFFACCRLHLPYIQLIVLRQPGFLPFVLLLLCL